MAREPQYPDREKVGGEISVFFFSLCFADIPFELLFNMSLTKSKNAKPKASTSSFSLSAVKAKTLGKDVKAKFVQRAEEDDSGEEEEDEGDEEEEEQEDEEDDDDDDAAEQWENVNEDDDEVHPNRPHETPTDINNKVRIHDRFDSWLFSSSS